MPPLPGVFFLCMISVQADIDVGIYIVAPDTFSQGAFVSNLRALVVGNSSNATNTSNASYAESVAPFIPSLPQAGVKFGQEQPVLCVGSDCYVQGATV